MNASSVTIASDTSLRLYYCTALSNFARAYDKYSGCYRKELIPQSHFAHEFYLLDEDSLAFGVEKAQRLVAQLALAHDCPVILESLVPRNQVRLNERTGIGFVIPQSFLSVNRIFLPQEKSLGEELTIEDATARSFALNSSRFKSYSDLTPRSISFLPVARGCQAACPFCFSEASVSSDQRKGRLSTQLVKDLSERARQRGATRAVITGGGEPTLMPWEELLELIRTTSAVFEKNVLITNGVTLARQSPEDRLRSLEALALSGLSVLAVSRHHALESVNARLMGLETRSDLVLKACQMLAESFPLKPRAICVLQKGGVESEQDVEAYLAWAAGLGLEEVCFKELYVSSSLESVYFSKESNQWSRAHHVPLSVVLSWAKRRGFIPTAQLPWGAPVFSGTLGGRPLRIAAYSEPSLYWERSTGLARSWNIMADGRCLVSLEDRRSEIDPLAPQAAPCSYPLVSASGLSV